MWRSRKSIPRSITVDGTGALSQSVGLRPDALAGCRHFDVGYAKFGKRIDDGVYHHAKPGDRPALTSRANAERWPNVRNSLSSVVKNGNVSARGIA